MPGAQAAEVVVAVGVGRDANRIRRSRSTCRAAHVADEIGVAVGAVRELEHDAGERRVVGRAIAVAERRRFAAA